MKRQVSMSAVALRDIRHSRARIAQNFELAVESFLNSRIAQNASRHTVEYYRQSLKGFVAFAETVGLNSPDKTEAEHINEYISWMKARGNDASTVNINLRACRAFFNYLFDGGYITRRLKIRLIKQDQKLISCFTLDEVNRLIATPDIKTISFADFRDYAMVCFMLAVGVRRNTLLSLKIGDIDLVNKEIRLRTTKSRKEQAIPLPASLDRILTAYLQVRGGLPDDYLFCNCFGEQLRPRSVEDRIKHYCKSRGVNPDGVRLGCHVFRHTFAKLAAMNGVDIVVLQRILGHASLTMTQRYINLLVGDLRQKFTSPLDVLAGTTKHGRTAIRMTGRRV